MTTTFNPEEMTDDEVDEVADEVAQEKQRSETKYGGGLPEDFREEDE